MDEIWIKKADKNILKELEAIGFDSTYKASAAEKYGFCAYKIFNLKPYEANILKQACLSLGFDCAVNRGSVNCSCDKTDCLISASKAQLKKLINKLEFQPFRLKEISKQLEAVSDSTLKPLITKKGAVFDGYRPYIMGILNVTPDSFSDGGRYNDADKAYMHCLKLIEDGADIIDIGGESTRPGADTISPSEEIKRVLPVIEKIIKNGINITISIDTRNYETAEAAVEAGADIINDVSGFDYDTRLAGYAAQNNIPSVIMHSDKVPAVSEDFSKGDIAEEIYKFLYNKIEKYTAAGLSKNNIIIDPGIGFGKSPAANFEIMRRIDEFESLGCLILSGISRKSFLRKTFNLTIEESDLPSAFFSASLNSVNIHRVHNVKLLKQFLDYASFIQ